MAENRPENRAANAYRPSASEIDAYRNGQTDRYGRTASQYNPLTANVTGDFSGTTDEIFQWAAHKWGIPEDVVRGVGWKESRWDQSQLGDRGWVPNPLAYPEYSRVAGTNDVYASLGLTQVRWSPEGDGQGTNPLRYKSTAFNVDHWAATVRYYYDGKCDWCSSGYSAGQEFASIGAWFNPSPWNASDAYVADVRTNSVNKPWLASGF